MSLWAIVASLIITLGIGNINIEYLPNIELLQKDNTWQAQFTNQPHLNPDYSIPKKISNNSFGVKLTAASAAVMDKASGQILWQKNAEEVRAIASISKLMTALVFLDNNPGWDTVVIMDKRDEVGGVKPNLVRGESVKVRDLFYTALIASDNNAMMALVRSTGLKQEEFVALMNKKAQALGLPNTDFVSVTGLDAGNRSTAREVLFLAKAAFANKDIRRATAQASYSFTAVSGRTHKISSTNHLFNSYLDIQAGKTGYITQSGYCLVAEFIGDDGQVVISVVLGSASNNDRFQDLKALTTWIFDNFSWS